MTIIIANKYKITGILCDGTFGKVFKAENILTKNRRYPEQIDLM